MKFCGKCGSSVTKVKEDAGAETRDMSPAKGRSGLTVKFGLLAVAMGSLAAVGYSVFREPLSGEPHAPVPATRGESGPTLSELGAGATEEAPADESGTIEAAEAPEPKAEVADVPEVELADENAADPNSAELEAQDEEVSGDKAKGVTAEESQAPSQVDAAEEKVVEEAELAERAASEKRAMALKALTDAGLLTGSTGSGEGEDLSGEETSDESYNESVQRANRLEGFTYLSTHEYSCGGNAYTLARYRHASTGLTFHLLPAGAYERGDEDGAPDERPVRKVEVDSFLICATECTQGVWEWVMKASPSHFKGAERPVEGVSWYDASDFCRKTDLRLPSEAEWEYASRGGSQGDYCFGSEAAELEEYAEFAANNGKATKEVGGKRQNAFGLHDMHGNVWEWCGDDYVSYLDAPIDGSALSSNGQVERVARGGSWGNKAWHCRSARRMKSKPDARGRYTGFRLAKSLPPPEVEREPSLEPKPQAKGGMVDQQVISTLRDLWISNRWYKLSDEAQGRVKREMLIAIKRAIHDKEVRDATVDYFYEHAKEWGNEVFHPTGRRGQVDYALALALRTVWRSERISRKPLAVQQKAFEVIVGIVRDQCRDPADQKATLDYIEVRIGSW